MYFGDGDFDVSMDMYFIARETAERMATNILQQGSTENNTTANEEALDAQAEDITHRLINDASALVFNQYETEQREQAAKEREKAQKERKLNLKYTQAELDARLQQQRKKFEEQQRTLENSLAEVRKTELEYKKSAEDRQKLLKVARRLNNMRTSPENLSKIPDILKEIDTQSVKILEKGYTDKNGHEVMGRIDLQNLKTKYYEIAKTDPNFIPDPKIEGKIARLDKTQISSMDIGAVRELTETLLEVEHEIRTSNKLINDAKRREVAKTAAESVREINSTRGTSLGAAANALNKYTSTQLSPERMFRRLAGYKQDSTFAGLADALNDGQRKLWSLK